MRKGKILEKIGETMAAIFAPLIPLLTACGLLKGILMILQLAGCVQEGDDVYTVMYAMGDSVFHFLPALVCFTAGKHFGADKYLCLMIGMILIYPNLTEAMGLGETLSFVGLPMRAVKYPSTILPAVAAAGLAAGLGKGFRKWFSQTLYDIIGPILIIFLTTVATLCVLGPVSDLVQTALAKAYEWLYTKSSLLAGFLLGMFIQPMVSVGLSWGLLVVALNNISVVGYDTILAILGPPVFAQAGACLGVMLRSRDGSTRAACMTAMISSLLGVTEPAIYNITIPRKKPMIYACIASGVGSAMVGIGGTKMYTFLLASIVNMPVYAAGGGFALYAGGCAVGFAGALILTYLLWREPEKTEIAENAQIG